MSAPTPDPIDFFISYTGKDEAWAEWIAWELEQAGYRTLIQAWDFKSGGVFPGDMHRALQNSARVVAVLTPDYMASAFCQPEWQAAFADDPTGEKGTLVLVRVADFKPDGLIRGRTYIDLVGLTESDARGLLLARLQKGRAKPTTAPSFPGSKPTAIPSFPGPSAAPPITAPSPTPISNNLPRLDPFFGRETELKQIAEALSEKSSSWGIVIDGQGGLGKTHLAIRAATDAPASRFLRKIFLTAQQHKMDAHGKRSLEGFRLNGWMEMINAIARELGQPDIAKAADTERTALLRSALAGSSSLLILDNLEGLTDSEQQNLLNFLERLPTDCKAILTTRPTQGDETNRLSQVENRLPLLKLDEHSALQLLEQMARSNGLLRDTNEQQRLSLYAQTNGNPLLLRWVAGQLGSGHCTTLEDALEFLRSCPEANDPLEFIFGDVLRSLEEDDLRVLAVLSYPSEPIDMQDIAEISGIKPNDTLKAAKRLTNRALTTSDTSRRLFALVPMVADFLKHEQGELVKKVGGRLEERAYKLILKNGYENHERFKVLDAAWATVAPALAAFCSGDNQRLQQVCQALTEYLHFSGKWDDWLSLSQKAEVVALASDDYFEAGWRAFHAGFVHKLWEHPTELMNCAQRAQQHWEIAAAGINQQAIALHLLGDAYELNEDSVRALKCHRDALSLLIENNADCSTIASSFNQVAGAELEVGDFESAGQSYDSALTLARNHNAEALVALYTGNLARLALRKGDWQRAELLAREALELTTKIGRLASIGANSVRLAYALVRQGAASEAQPYARRGAEIFAKLGSPELTNAEEILRQCEAQLAKA